MTQIIVSGETVIHAQPDDSVIVIATGLVTRADGSSFILGDLASYSPEPTLHQDVSLPDSDPGARPYLVWTGSAVETGPGYAAYQADLAAEHKAAALAAIAQRIAAGITIASTGTPALDGAYAIDTDAKSVIDGIYAGIKSGDGLPGGGSTFVFHDMAGSPHSFDATGFSALAKAVRDYLYALAQGETPTLPVTIP